MIDTLKLTKRLTAASMPIAQAEALSEGLAESLKETYVTREYLDARLADMRAYIASVRTELVLWMFGLIGGATLINHWWK